MTDEKNLKDQDITNQPDDTAETPSPAATEQTNQEKPLDDTWAADSQDELEDWIEEQGIQLRY